MKINILLCDTFPGLLPEYIPSYESMFMKLFDENVGGLDYHVYRTLDGELPEELNHDDVYLITGCNLSAYDDIKWIKDLQRWIVRANDEKVKMVGICFGHQIIAEALGGKVCKAKVGWGTGIRESVITNDEALQYFPKGRMRLMYNHHDQVVELPVGAVAFATSEFCPNEGFMIGNHVITFQGHPEYVPQYAVHLIMNFADDEPLDVRVNALKSLGAYEHDGGTVARWIAERFS